MGGILLVFVWLIYQVLTCSLFVQIIINYTYDSAFRTICIMVVIIGTVVNVFIPFALTNQIKELKK